MRYGRSGVPFVSRVTSAACDPAPATAAHGCGFGREIKLHRIQQASEAALRANDLKQDGQAPRPRVHSKRRQRRDSRDPARSDVIGVTSSDSIRAAPS
jgi:hypothetical protein